MSYPLERRGSSPISPTAEGASGGDVCCYAAAPSFRSARKPMHVEQAASGFDDRAPESSPPEDGRSGRVVRVDPHRVLLPAGCACCGGSAAATRVERRLLFGPSLIVPYCRDCHGHASAASTRAFAVVVSGCLLAVAFAAGLPLWDAWLSLPLLLAIAVGAASIPGLVARLLQPRARPGHSAAARAVWWSSGSELSGTNVAWMAELAAQNGTSARAARVVEPKGTALMAIGPMVALLCAPFLHQLHHSPVWVVNLTPSRLLILADGRPLGWVEPSSAETPAAGARLRVPAGRRTLSANDATGRAVSVGSVLVHSGARHLYAPASPDHCFWIETTGYGESGAATRATHVLSDGFRFWLLPPVIDSWFAPNPAGSGSDAWATGGELVALRQARCDRAPEAVRAALRNDAR